MEQAYSLIHPKKKTTSNLALRETQVHSCPIAKANQLKVYRMRSGSSASESATSYAHTRLNEQGVKI